MAWQRCPGIPPDRCGRLTAKRRCDECGARYETIRTRRKRAQRPLTRAEIDRRAAVVAQWVAEHGQVCPGWRREPHGIAEWTGPLTAEHPDAVAAGGAEGQPLTVLCSLCNNRKGARA